jgi:hypothetical protein
MATRMPSQGTANDPIIVDAATADQTVPACLSSREVASTALGQGHADGVATRSGFSKGKHPAETTSTPTSTHAARFDFRSVLMDHADGDPSQCSGCLDLLRPGRVFKGEHPSGTTASGTSRHDFRFDAQAAVMDDMDHDERGGCLGLQHRAGLGVFKAEHPTARSASLTSSHAAGFDIRPVMMDDAEDVSSQRGACLDLLHPAPGGFLKGEHSTETSASRTSGFDTHAVVVMDVNHAERVGCLGLQYRGALGVFAEHPTANSASQTSHHAAGFDIPPAMMDDADGVPSQRGACFRLQQHDGSFSKRQLPINDSSSPVSSYPATFVLDRRHSVASTLRANIYGLFVGLLHHSNFSLRSLLARMSFSDVNIVSPTWRFKASIILFLLMASFASTASGRPVYDSCPRSNFCSMVLHSNLCYAEHKLAFTQAMANVDPAPPIPPISGNL